MDVISIANGLEYGKFIQVYLNDKPFLVIDSSNLRHQSILERVLRENQISFENVRLNGPNFGPKQNGERYRLVGAGLAFPSSTWELSGRSDSYGIGPNENHAQEVQALTKIPITIK